MASKRNTNNTSNKNANNNNNNRKKNEEQPPAKAYYTINTHPLSAEYCFSFLKKEKGAPPAAAEAPANAPVAANSATAHSYEDQVKIIGNFSTVEAFWGFYSHLQRPHQMPLHSEFHVFRKGIKPMWEDEANAKGGKLTIRIKKELTNRLWEDLLLAVIGDQFEVPSDEICGIVLGIRDHDVLSLWHRNADNHEVREKLKEKLKTLLKLPPKTHVEYRAHDTVAEKVRQQQLQQQLLQQQQQQIGGQESTLTSDEI